MAAMRESMKQMIDPAGKAYDHGLPDIPLSSSPPESSPPGRAADMNASVDLLAEQMLTLVEIVSAQEKDIKALKEQCRRHEENDQAIMVAFTTFFHVLAARRVVRLDEISTILQNIGRIAEQEQRPHGSVKFLQDLAAMLGEQTGGAGPDRSAQTTKPGH